MPKTEYAVKLDIIALIESLGGPRAVRDSLVRLGVADITLGAVEKWAKRGQAPADAIAALLYVKVLRDQEYVDIYEFIRQERPPAAQAA
jgi:hypothetical protein